MDLWTPFHARLHRTIRQRHLLEKRQSVLVAVSGGQDSLCLIKLLLDLRSRWNWNLAIAHCDHRWRSDSQANAEYVAGLATVWELPFYLKTAEEVPANEAAARQWRYASFQTIAEQEGFSTIATGHTLSDRAETFLFNLMRGSGADGLQSLSWKRSLTPTLTLIRPILGFTRLETAAFCQSSNLKIWQDETNQDLRYSRNRIRQELLPYLKAHFNPQTEQHLAQTMELLTADVEYLETLATELREKACQHDCLNRRLLRAVPLALQRRVVRQFLQQSLKFNPNFEQVEKFVALIEAPNRSRTDPFLRGAIAEVEGDWIQIKPQN